jgi:Integrase core domain/Integrase zinc binding domain
MNRINKFYKWPYMREMVDEVVRNCKVCQLNKKGAAEPPVPLCVTTTSKAVNDLISIDLVGPLNEGPEGQKHILTICDNLSRYLVAIAITDQKAETVADAFIKNYILIYGASTICLSDLGKNFESAVFKRICKTFNVKKIFTSAYRPQSSFVERLHQDLGVYLRSFSNNNKNNWPELLPFFVFSYNTAVHRSTQHTPFSLMFGRTANLPYQKAEKIPLLYNFDDDVENLKYNLKKTAIDSRRNQLLEKEKRKAKYDEKYDEMLEKLQD